MKSLTLLTFLLLSAFFCRAQEYTYVFKVEHVETYSIAKPLISIFRKAYNPEGEPLRFSPGFNDETGRFTVVSSLKLEQGDLQELLSDYDYQLVFFERTENEIHATDESH